MRLSQIETQMLQPQHLDRPIIENTGKYLVALPVLIKGKLGEGLLFDEYMPSWVSLAGHKVGRVRFQIDEKPDQHITIEGVLAVFGESIPATIYLAEQVKSVDFGDAKDTYIIDDVSVTVGNAIHLVDFEHSSMTVLYREEL